MRIFKYFLIGLEFLSLVFFAPLALSAPMYSPQEKADAIVEQSVLGTYFDFNASEELQILSLENSDGVVEVMFRFFRESKQIGYGADGSVDIERLRIYNPPVLVPDPTGIISREYVLPDGKTGVASYSYDPSEALTQVVFKVARLVGKENSDPVIGKVGRTTHVFYPTIDGRVGNDPPSSVWSVARDADAGTFAFDDEAVSNAISTSKDSLDSFGIRRAFFRFDTSAIADTDTIVSAYLSLWPTQVNDNDNDGDDFVSVVSVDPAEIEAIGVADFDQIEGTDLNFPLGDGVDMLEISDRVDLGVIGTGAYNDFDFNANGLARISKTGFTGIGAAEGHDVLNEAYAGTTNTDNAVVITMADETGTSADPMLTVVTSDESPPVAGGGGSYQWTSICVEEFSEGATTTNCYRPLDVQLIFFLDAILAILVVSLLMVFILRKR